MKNTTARQHTETSAPEQVLIQTASDGRARPGLAWLAPAYSQETYKMLRYRTYDTLWQLYVMESIVARKHPEAVRDFREEGMRLTAELKENLATAAAALTEDLPENWETLAREIAQLEPAGTWRAEIRSPLAKSYVETLAATNWTGQGQPQPNLAQSLTGYESLTLVLVNRDLLAASMAEERVGKMRARCLTIGRALRKLSHDIQDRYNVHVPERL